MEQKSSELREDTKRLPQRRYLAGKKSLARLPTNLLRPNAAAKEDEMNPKSDFVISRVSVSSMAGIEIVKAFLREAREKYAKESNKNMAKGKVDRRDLEGFG